ncbi:hypothetical protein ABIE67_004936 [Streptomyces sp. V4I8]|uniref:hypothetical protein n=1 Tax=Streptomyces sp. V4I8 TaxID=3156469 RepID=UPI0035194D41
MRTDVELTRDGEDFVARLTRDQALAMYEALTHLRHRDGGEDVLALRLGAGGEAVDSLIERLAVGRADALDVRFRWEELHVVHCALTSVATMFMSRGRLLQEPFHIRVGFFRENLDALAVSIVDAASEVAG